MFPLKLADDTQPSMTEEVVNAPLNITLALHVQDCSEANINIQEKPYNANLQEAKNLQKNHWANTGHAQKHHDLWWETPQ